ncbi:unnamed protein product [Chrysoparadoxa australica]
MYGHSTGGLVCSMYQREGKYSPKVSAYIFNSPFFDWNVGSLEKHFINLRSKAISAGIDKRQPTKPLAGNGTAGNINVDLLRIWTQYYYESGKRNPHDLVLTQGWAAAVTEEQRKLRRALPSSTPTLILTSRHDRTLKSEDLLEAVDYISVYRTCIELHYARHDVLLSPFPQATAEALGFFRTWLETHLDGHIPAAFPQPAELAGEMPATLQASIAEV